MLCLQDFKDSNNNLFPSQPLDKAALDHRILDAIQRRAAAKLHLADNKQAGEPGCLTIGQAAESGCLTIGQSGDAGCLTIGPPGEPGCLTIGQSGESGCLSLGLLNSFTSSSSVTGSRDILNPEARIRRGPSFAMETKRFCPFAFVEHR